jgi:hypothetical protein
MKGTFGIEGVVRWARHPFKDDSRFQRSQRFCGINPGRCRWAGMSDACGVKMLGQSYFSPVVEEFCLAPNVAPASVRSFTRVRRERNLVTGIGRGSRD